MEENFVNEFVSKLNGKISTEEMKIVFEELQIYLKDYDVVRRKNEIVKCNTFGESYQMFLISKKLEGRSDRTLNLYKKVLDISSSIINKPVEEINSNDIRYILYEMKRVRKICDNTLNQRRTILNNFFNWANKNGYIKDNPCGLISPIKYEKPHVENLTEYELELIRDKCENTRERAIVEFLYSTGCRVSELLGVKISDVDFIKNKVWVYGKGNEHRYVYLNEKANYWINKWLNERKNDSIFLFNSLRYPYGKLTKENVERILKNIGNRCNIHLHPHKFRHTMATNALNRGMSLSEVQQLLGHKQPGTTINYAKANQENVEHDYKKCVI